MALYLLHFEPAYVASNGRRVAHYLGFSNDIPARLREHCGSRGSPLVGAAKAQGCRIVLVRTWPEGTRTEERRLKKQRNLPRLCPRCSGEAAWQRGTLPPALALTADRHTV